MSQNSRILSVLADGNPHTTAEIHRIAGFSRLNSRIAELRKRGLVIECAYIGGTGPEAFEYRLQPSSAGTETAPPPLEKHPRTQAVGNGSSPSPCPPALVEPVQLRLVEAA
jgi:hypothetical protein